MGKPHARAEDDTFRGISEMSQGVAGNCSGRPRKIPRARIGLSPETETAK